MVHLPKGYDQQQHYPVVVLLHGRNQDADDMARLTHFNQLADKDSIIAVYPNATRGQWNIGVRPEQRRKDRRAAAMVVTEDTEEAAIPAAVADTRAAAEAIPAVAEEVIRAAGRAGANRLKKRVNPSLRMTSPFSTKCWTS